MIGAFWESVGGRLADVWVRVSAQAVVFWLAVLAAFLLHRGDLRPLADAAAWLDRQSAVVQTATVLAALVAVTGSAVVVHWFALPVLRLSEGYWPRWAAPVRRRLVARGTRRAAPEAERWQQVYARAQRDHLTADDVATFARLERRMRGRPADPAYLMPTRVGNILRAGERRVHDKYGLDPIVTWPRLWLLLPDTARVGLASARAAMDRAVTAMIWGLLFCGCLPFTAFAPVAGLGVALVAGFVVLPRRAATFSALLESAFDLYRADLYRQLRLPTPATTADEVRVGKQLTAYLWRGADSAGPLVATFVDTEPRT